MNRIHTGVFEPGPWVQAFWFELPGPPRSKSNARRFTRGKADAAARRAYKADKQFAQHVHTIATSARPPGWELGPTGDGTLSERPQVVAVVLARTTLDATNVPKSLHDAVEGVVFHNDASVRSASQQTVRSNVDRGGLVAFARLDPDATPRQVAQAEAALKHALLATAEGRVAGFEADPAPTSD